MDLKKLLTQSIIWRGFYFFSLLLVNIFLSRYLQAAGAGNLYFITIILSFLQVVLSLGVESGVIYFASGNIIERNKLISLMGLWSVVAGLMTVGFVYVYFLIAPGRILLLSYCIYSFLFVCGQSLTNYSTAIYYTKENYFLPNFLLGAVNLVFIMIIPGKNGTAGASDILRVIYLYFATFFIGGLLVYLSFIIKNRKESSFGFPEQNQLFKFLRYAITALAANVIFFLVYRIDYFFVNSSPVCTAADLGNYIQVSKLGQMLLVVPQIIASVVFPRTASGVDRSRLNNAIMIIARLLSQLFLVLFIIIIFMGAWFFTAVFGESFNKMQIPMLIVMPGIFALSVLSLLSAYFSGKGKVSVNVRGAILGLVVMIIGDYFLVPRYGIVAAAAVSTVSYAVNLGYAFLQFYRDYSISWIEFIKWKKEDYNWLLSILKRDVN
jgi:O-antigen/teichoic acid export membrane protein